MLAAPQVMWGVKRAKLRKRRGSASGPSGSRPKRAPRQLSLAELRTWGGPRKGAGRKPREPGARRNVVHRLRPAHPSNMPVHVTLRRAKGLPGFRSERMHRVLQRAIRDTRREGFRVTHDSIQSDHLHILVEAEGKTALSNGMRSLAVRIAMRVNSRVLGRRRGHVWGDRYHRRDLTSPSSPCPLPPDPASGPQSALDLD